MVRVIILIYDIAYKNLIGTNPLRTSFDKVNDLLEFTTELDI